MRGTTVANFQVYHSTLQYARAEIRTTFPPSQKLAYADNPNSIRYCDVLNTHYIYMRFCMTCV